MTDIVILCDTGSDVALAIRETLRDWAAIGLLDRFLWVDALSLPADPRSGAVRVPALLVDAQNSTRVDAGDWVTARVERVSDAELLVLQLPDTAGAIDSATAQSLCERISLQGCRPVNVIAPSFLHDRPPVSPVWPAYQNVLLQPLDAREPDTGLSRLASGEPDFALNVASGLASLAGLWRGMSAAGLAAIEHSPVGAQVNVMRCYVRWVDASATFDGLQAALLDEQHDLPLAHGATGPLVAIGGGRGADVVEEAADKLLDSFGELHFAAPEPFVAPLTRNVGLLKAIKDFLGFLIAVIRSAPRRWLDTQISAVGGAATQLIYGADSGYRIVLRPVTADRSDPVDNIASGIRQVLSSRGSTPPLPNTAPIWHAMIDAATGLADGSQLPDQVATPMHAGERQIVVDPDLIAPPPSAPSLKVGYGVLPGVGSLSVSARDPLAALVTHELIEVERAKASNATAVSGLDAASAELETFARHQRNYAWRFQLGLAGQIQAARSSLSEAVASAEQADLIAMRGRVDAAQGSAGRFVKRMALVLLAIVLVLAVLAVTAVLPLLGMLAVAVLALGGWLVGSAFGYLNQQRLLYQLLHQLDLAGKRASWAQQAVGHIEAELSRLVSIYQQGRLWTAVLSESVHSVFGAAAVEDAGSQKIGMLSGELPLHMRVASSEFRSDQQQGLLRELSRSLFGAGWLSDRLRQRFDSVLAGSADASEAGQRIWTDSGANPGGPLRQLADQVGSVAALAQARVAVTADLVEWIGQRQRGPAGRDWLVDQLLPELSVRAGGDGSASGHPSGREFLLRLLQDRAPGTTNLGADGFTAAGRSADGAQVICTAVAAEGVELPETFTELATEPRRAGAALDQMLVRIDFSRPLEPSALVFTARDVDEPPPPSRPDQPGGWIPPLIG